LLNNGQLKGVTMNPKKVVEFKGRQYTRDVLAKHLGLSKTSLIYRIKKGIPLDAPKGERRKNIILDALGMRACPECGKKYEYKNKRHKCGSCIYKMVKRNREFKARRMALHGW